MNSVDKKVQPVTRFTTKFERSAFSKQTLHLSQMHTCTVDIFKIYVSSPQKNLDEACFVTAADFETQLLANRV
jgi:hypothetical protein